MGQADMTEYARAVAKRAGCDCEIRIDVVRYGVCGEIEAVTVAHEPRCYLRRVANSRWN